LPFTNGLITVPQDKFIAAEYFGSFRSLHSPGLACVGCDLFGMCISLRSITSRVEQLVVTVPTKTQDNVFVQVLVAVQFSVNPESARDAFYRLSDVGAQIDAYVSDVVRSQLPRMTLDESFEAKDKVSNTVQEELGRHMMGYGFTIHKALVTEIAVSQDVMRSMNEINKQKRLRDASVMQAEAEKIRVVKAAEADADATCLSGQGTARQRAAIVQGLRDSISVTGREVSQADIIELLLATQYFETLRDIGAHKNCKAYFLPDNAEDFDSQVRQGMLEGQAALEYMVQNQGGGPMPPRQETMRQSRYSYTPPPAPAPARQSTRSYTTPFALEDSGPAEPAAYEAPPPPPQRQSLRQQQQQQQPAYAQQPAFARQPVTLQVAVPQGVGAGQQLQVQAPDGRTVLITVPPGVGPGAVLQVQV